MSIKYFGFAFSAAMLHLPANVRFEACDLNKKEVEEEAVSCLNPSHATTIAALKSRFNINPTIPEKAPIVKLLPGDELILLQVTGLPRLGADRKEYTDAEISSAQFTAIRCIVS